MTIRKILLAAAALAALSPSLSTASPERASLQACASALASSMAAPGAAAPAFKVLHFASTESALTAFYPTEFTFQLEAHDPKTGAEVARAMCSTNAHGEVTSLSLLPLQTRPATFAARF